jgi:hypothetical protein
MPQMPGRLSVGYVTTTNVVSILVGLAVAGLAGGERMHTGNDHAESLT